MTDGLPRHPSRGLVVKTFAIQSVDSAEISLFEDDDISLADPSFTEFTCMFVSPILHLLMSLVANNIKVMASE